MRWRRAKSPAIPTAAASEAGGAGQGSGAEPGGVAGERDLPSVNRERSLQARLHNGLALALLAVLAAAFLLWWYSHANREVAEQARAKKEREARTSGEMKLPPLGPIEGPRAAATDLKQVPDEGPTLIGDVLGPPPAAGVPAAGPFTASVPPPAGPAAPTPAQLELQRKLTPSVLYRQAGSVAPPSPAGGGEGRWSPTASGEGAGGAAGIGAYLTPTVTPATAAQLLTSRRFVIPKGNFIDCTLETALDSQLPGLVTCVTAVDIFGADGNVVLIERGSKLVGESKGEVRQGMNRVFVLWTEARTPTGVVVHLASPGTDALGRSGLPGYADTHFWSRFGAAILISVIDGAFRIGAQAATRSDTSVVLTPGASRDVMTEVLRNTIAVPPTVVKNQGERIQVLVARDVDFRPVYELRATAIDSPSAPVAPEAN